MVRAFQPGCFGCGCVMQDGHSLANVVSLEKLFQYADTHSYHQDSVGGTTSFISSFYSDFALITLSKQISHNLKSHTGANTYSAMTVCPLLTESLGKLDEITSSLERNWSLETWFVWSSIPPVGFNEMHLAVIFTSAYI